MCYDLEKKEIFKIPRFVAFGEYFNTFLLSIIYSNVLPFCIVMLLQKPLKDPRGIFAAISDL